MTPSLDIMTMYDTCQDLVQTIIACHTRALRFLFAMTWCVCAFHYQIYIKTCHCHLGCHIHITIQLSKLGLFADNISSYNIYSLLISMSRENASTLGMITLTTQVLGSIARGFRQHGRLVAEYPWPIIIFRFCYN